MSSPDGTPTSQARNARLDGAVLAALIAALRDRGRPLGETESKAIQVALACARFLRQPSDDPATREAIDALYDALRAPRGKLSGPAELAAAHEAVRDGYRAWHAARRASRERRDELLSALRARLHAIDPAFGRLSVAALRDAFARHDRASVGTNNATETLTAILANECGALGAGSGRRRLGVASLRRAIEEAGRTAA